MGSNARKWQRFCFWLSASTCLILIALGGYRVIFDFNWKAVIGIMLCPVLLYMYLRALKVVGPKKDTEGLFNNNHRG